MAMRQWERFGALCAMAGVLSACEGGGSSRSKDASGSDAADSGDGSTDATDAADSTDAADASDGADATDASDATDAAEASDATDAAEASDATDAADASDGADLTDATDGGDSTDQPDGTDGMDGTDGLDGTDGMDGTSGPVKYCPKSNLYSAQPGVIQIKDVVLGSDQTWTKDNVYAVLAAIEVEDVTLTIEAGTVVCFASGTGISVGSINPGVLRVLGTEEEPVVFTSGTMQPGLDATTYDFWRGVSLITEPSSDAVTMTSPSRVMACIASVDRPMRTGRPSRPITHSVSSLVNATRQPCPASRVQLTGPSTSQLPSSAPPSP